MHSLETVIYYPIQKLWGKSTLCVPMTRVRFRPSGAPGPIDFGGHYDFAYVILKEL